MKYSVVLAGVGGQGIILANRVILLAAVKKGYEARGTESMGMAQRGGSVVSHLRFGSEIYSPMVSDGGADVLLGFEIIEAVRRANKLKPGGTAIINNLLIPPREMISGSFVHDTSKLIDFLNGLKADIFVRDITGIASDVGSSRVTSAVMLGAFSAGFSPLEPDLIRETLVDLVPVHLAKMNLTAFETGRKIFL